jgi:hypothetical protein
MTFSAADKLRLRVAGYFPSERIKVKGKICNTHCSGEFYGETGRKLTFEMLTKKGAAFPFSRLSPVDSSAFFDISEEAR